MRCRADARHGICLLLAGVAWGPFCQGRAFAESTPDARLQAIAGAGLVHARLAFTAPTALVETRVDALPVAHLGLEAWPEPALGLYLLGDIGTGATLTLPGGGPTLAYNAHQLRAGAWYRWQPDSGGAGWDVRLGLGLAATAQRVQAQNPALLVESQVAGPAVDARVERFFLRRRASVGLGAFAGLPFYVREAPQDSGDPTDFVNFGGILTGSLRFGETWGLEFEARHSDTRIEFRGEGTRAAGITNGRTHDAFTTAILAVAYRL